MKRRIFKHLMTSILLTGFLSGCTADSVDPPLPSPSPTLASEPEEEPVNSGQDAETPFTPKDGGLYIISNKATGRRLNMQLAGMVEHARVIQMGESGMLDEIWRVIAEGDAWRVQNVMTGRYVTCRDFDTGGIVDLIVDATDAGLWSLSGTDAGALLRPVGRSENVCLGLTKNDGASDNFPVLTEQASDDTQCWVFEAVTDLPEELPRMLPLDGEVFHASCPQIAKYDGVYYMFTQSPNIVIKSSPDLIHWETATRAFPGGDPSWFTQEVPGYGIWAPSTYYINGRYYLYYCISTLGSQNSAIGLAYNTTLNPEEEGYRWVDAGMVIRSWKGSLYNCIDPNISFDDNGDIWLTFGSYWNGVYQLQINPETGHLLDPEAEPIHIAKRMAQNGAIEAPYVIKKDGLYYLFTAFNPMNLSYHNRVGRSENLHGPFIDKNGQAMLTGGGTPVTTGLPELHMPGHASVFLDDDGQYYFVGEYFRGDSPSIMMISTIVWDADGWPITALTPDIRARLGQDQ